MEQPKREGTFFTFMRGFEGALGVLRAFIVPKILGPGYYGFLHLFAMIGFFAPLLEGGVLSGMQKKISTSLNQEDPLKSKQWQQTAFLFYFGMVGLASLILFGFFCLLPTSFLHYFLHTSELSLPELEKLLFWGGMAYCLLLPLNALEFYTNAWCTSYSKFGYLGKLVLLKNVVNTAVVLGTVWFIGVYSVWLGLVLSAFFVALYLKKTFSYPSFSKFTGSKLILKNLIKEGLPIVLLTFFTQLLLITDRVMLLWFRASIGDLGFYVLGLSLVNYLFIIPHAVSQIFFPLIYKETAVDLESRDLKKYFALPVIGLLGIATLIVGWAYLILPELIHFILPKWVPGISAARVMIWITCFYGPIQLAVPLFAGREKTRLIYFHQIPAILFAIISNYFALKWGYGIVGVGFTTVLTTFLYCYALITSGYYVCEGHFKGYCFFFAASLSLFAYFAGGSFLVDFWMTDEFGNRWFLFQRMVLKTVYYFLTITPGVLFLEWKSQFFRKFFKKRAKSEKK